MNDSELMKNAPEWVKSLEMAGDALEAGNMSVAGGHLKDAARALQGQFLPSPSQPQIATDSQPELSV